ncbi:t-SNARE affecting a late Golgi compartment protein 1 [Golovinomyces cichoracearum]|uniref:t-SNARE affecting a late Golgi compartment protein 1 n=1 Tax=Golovinomyces cichoracearum TaxID=62708 RepID=A0A420IN46_9PEZI|nr:t-SNARE affecting a late Golgi compartment protein 1 [Golovinomyces cichoracearum]
MSSYTEDDPFLQVQADVLSQLHFTRPLFTSYQRICSFTTSPDNPELVSSRSELSAAIESLSEDLADLNASVQAVQSDPFKYGLEIEEVVRRRKLCDDVDAELQEMRASLGPTSSSPSIPKNRLGHFTMDPDEAAEDTNNDYSVFAQEPQSQILAEQDTQLENVSQTVYKIRQQASEMGRELEEQAELLDRVDGLADRVGGRLQTGMKSLGTVIRRNEDGLSTCCIGALIVILVLLLIMVLLW